MTGEVHGGSQASQRKEDRRGSGRFGQTALSPRKDDRYGERRTDGWGWTWLHVLGAEVPPTYLHTPSCLTTQGRVLMEAFGESRTHIADTAMTIWPGHTQSPFGSLGQSPAAVLQGPGDGSLCMLPRPLPSGRRAMVVVSYLCLNVDLDHYFKNMQSKFF